MSDNLNNLTFIQCDFNNLEHQTNALALLNHYMNDKMGNGMSLSKEQEVNLINEFKAHQSAFILFAKIDNQYIGLTTYFINIATFFAKKYINIHDVVIRSEYRGLKIGKLMLENIIEIARKENCIRVNLEVRHDNYNAQHLYKNLGFKESEPPMYFWTKYLD